MIEIIVPHFDVNSDHARLIEWTVKEAELVQKGQLICVVETTKSTYEMHAAQTGVLGQAAPADHDVQFGQVIGFIADNAEELAKARTHPPEAPKTASGEAAKITKRALELAKQHGIDPGSIHKAGIITEADIRAAMGTASKAASPWLPPYEAPGKINRVLVIPGGYGATQVIDVLLQTHGVHLVGCLDDDPALENKLLFGVRVLGKTDLLEKLWRNKEFDSAIVALGTNPQVRKKFYDRCVALGIPLTNAIDPTVLIHRGAVLGQGNVILSQGHIGACTVIGDNNFFSARTSLDHHNIWGSHNTLGPNNVTSALVSVGDLNKFGMGISIQPRVEIGSECLIASGAVIIRPVPTRHAVRTKITTEMEPITR